MSSDAPGHVEVGVAGLGSVAELEHLHGAVGLSDLVQREPEGGHLQQRVITVSMTRSLAFMGSSGQ